jgi:DNA-3-methyladenine glycosylase II
MQTEIAPVAPYDFAQVLAYLRRSSSAVLERISDDDVYHRALTISGKDVLLTMKSVGSIEAPHLLLDVQGTGVDEAIRAEAAAFVRHVFSLDLDPTEFYQLTQAEPVFGALVQRYYGLRPVMVASPFEATIWAIIGQQINVSFARKLKQKLIELCGEQLHIAGESYPLMPTAAAIAALDPTLLLTNQFSRQKTEYVIGAAQAVTSGELDFAAAAKLPHEEAIAYLTRLRGLGRWTAEYVLMRGIGVRDSMPAADMGLRIAIGRAYALGRNASEQEVRDFAANWAGWRSWAAFFWWHALQLREV